MEDMTRQKKKNEELKYPFLKYFFSDFPEKKSFGQHQDGKVSMS